MEVNRVLRPGGRAIIWDIAPPHPVANAQPDHGGNAHGAEVHAPGGPSLVQTLRMLMVFRRIPSQRYDFTKPAA